MARRVDGILEVLSLAGLQRVSKENWAGEASILLGLRFALGDL